MQCRAFEIAGIAAYPTRAAWDAAAVDILGSVLSRWRLTPGEPFVGGYSGSVLRVTTADGLPAVLKVGYPHEEAVLEAVGLQALGAAAPEVLDQDPWSWAMLLEEIRPGIRLSVSDLPVRRRLLDGAALLARIGATGPVVGLPMLADVVHEYVAVARARRDGQLERLQRLDAVALVGEAIDELEALADSGPANAFVHGDFNPGNILSRGADWIVVDPKPTVGDPSYDLWPLVAQLGSPFGAGRAREVLIERLAVGAAEAGLDPVRATRWAFARTGLNVSWYLEEQNIALAARDVAELRVWADIRRSVIR